MLVADFAPRCTQRIDAFFYVPHDFPVGLVIAHFPSFAVAKAQFLVAAACGFQLPGAVLPAFDLAQRALALGFKLCVLRAGRFQCFVWRGFRGLFDGLPDRLACLAVLFFCAALRHFGRLNDRFCVFHGLYAGITCFGVYTEMNACFICGFLLLGRAVCFGFGAAGRRNAFFFTAFCRFAGFAGLGLGLCKRAILHGPFCAGFGSLLAFQRRFAHFMADFSTAAFFGRALLCHGASFHGPLDSGGSACAFLRLSLDFTRCSRAALRAFSNAVHGAGAAFCS